MSVVVKIEDLWKEYRLGVIGHGTLTHDLQSWWARVRGKEDPNSQVSLVAAVQEQRIKGEHFWALQGIDLEVKEGEIFGIIGRNGAGKSTLLKILSRVTAPTKGSVKVKGRIASLLEVGTGFHPELTGRENIFLNGAILGMPKQEIRGKLDEIIDFSEVESFVDTPVKRYSSGMYVRLAFAVAAHLEPEILVIDEVLAVGDVSFQKKCINYMSGLQGTGRTLLFVSHNMNVMQRLCQKCLLLNDGKVDASGGAQEIVSAYLSSQVGAVAEKKWNNSERPGDHVVRLCRVRAYHKDSDIAETSIDIRGQITIEIEYEILEQGAKVSPGYFLYDNYDNIVFISMGMHDQEWIDKPRSKGRYISKCLIPENFLAEGVFMVRTIINTMDPDGIKRPVVHVDVKDAVSFRVYDPIEGGSARGNHVGAYYGVVRPILEWETWKDA